MAMLRNYNTGDNVNFTIFLKKFTFFFLVLSYLTYNDVSPYCKSLENIYKQDRTFNAIFNRVLASHEHLRELERTKLREKLPDRRPYMEKRNVYGNLSAYSGIKTKASNNIDLYMKNYKNRYMRKKGLSKLDCYYENKVFKKFNNICDIGEKMKYDEKLSKRFFIKKYGIGLIIFALIPTLGFISPILFGIGKHPGIYGLCEKKHFQRDTGVHLNTGDAATCDKKWLYIENVPIKCISYIPSIFSFITIIIVVSVVFYILIKIMKYEDIKAGKGKMGIKG